MLLHVVFRQFDSYGETLDNKDDSREFEGDLIGIAPGRRVNEVCRDGAEDDTADGGYGRFTDIESFLNEGGTQHEQRREAAEDDVYQMRFIDGQVIPSHLDG